MATPLDEYHAFIDGLVAERPSYLADAVRQQRYQFDPESARFIAGLTPAEREMVAGMIQKARDVAISDTLAYVREQQASQGLRLARNGVALPVEPHHTMNSDWWCRCQGEAWPEAVGEVFESGNAD